MKTAIRQVWSYNFQTEMMRLDKALFKYKVVSIDTEFPGFFRDTPRDATDLVRYKDLRFNVDSLKLIQWGVTVSDDKGRIFKTWEFNFSFNLAQDLYVCESVKFLQNNGIDFDRNREEGINVSMFAKMLANVLSRHRDLCWVTFHGLYDLAYTLKLVTKENLPSSLVKFTKLLGIVFSKVVDVKFMAKFCEGLYGGGLGLSKLAKILEIDRIGGEHQAGSDSLLTAQVFARMRMLFPVDASIYLGCLYGLGTRISLTLAPAPVLQGRNPQISHFVPYHYRIHPCNVSVMYNVPV